ncbi:hypothetical protein ABK040_009166 [Willaertia magna]
MIKLGKEGDVLVISDKKIDESVVPTDINPLFLTKGLFKTNNIAKDQQTINVVDLRFKQALPPNIMPENTSYIFKHNNKVLATSPIKKHTLSLTEDRIEKKDIRSTSECLTKEEKKSLEGSSKKVHEFLQDFVNPLVKERNKVELLSEVLSSVQIPSENTKYRPKVRRKEKATLLKDESVNNKSPTKEDSINLQISITEHDLKQLFDRPSSTCNGFIIKNSNRKVSKAPPNISSITLGNKLPDIFKKDDSSHCKKQELLETLDEEKKNSLPDLSFKNNSKDKLVSQTNLKSNDTEKQKRRVKNGFIYKYKNSIGITNNNLK